MNLTDKDIDKIANLARLNSKDKDNNPIVEIEDLNKILHFVEQIQNIDTDNVEPMYHSFDVNQPLAKDEVSEPNVKDEMLKIAPNTDSGYFIVPKVVE